jgi:hypothetical protein
VGTGRLGLRLLRSLGGHPRILQPGVSSLTLCAMTERRLHYTERLRLAAEGTLGDIVHDEMPYPLRRALLHLLTASNTVGARKFRQAVWDHARLFTAWADNCGWTDLITDAHTDYVLEMLELAAAEDPGLEPVLNEMFERWLFGFRIENGTVRQIDSPVLAREITAPALLATQRAGWDHVETAYREALVHRRAGDYADALDSTLAAVEAALKAAGFTGSSLGALATAFKKSPLVDGYAEDLADNITTLLNRLMGWRSVRGKSHGKAPGAPAEAPEELAALAIHWAGAFIVYLDAITP